MADKEIRVVNTDGLFQIAEPTATSAIVQRSPGKAIGIDLGTTHSLIAWAPKGAAPRVLFNDGDHESALLPSVVSYVDESVKVGPLAVDQALRCPERVISSVKRFMGRSQDDIQFQHPYRMACDRGVIRMDVGREKPVTPIEVSSEILKALKKRADAQVEGGVEGAVITVPAYFDEAQRQATKDAGRLAGLSVLRLLAEPTAAALAYGLDQKRQGLFAIYDLGGGTFDISILRLAGGVFQVLATGGDTALGGDDFDRRLAQTLLEAAKVFEPSNRQYQEAMVQARIAKQILSDVDEVVVSLPSSDLFDFKVSRTVLESLIESDVRRTLKVCRSTLKDAGLRASELDGVVLVGGSTRVPLVRNLVEQMFGHKPYAELDPDRVVALGAAIQADILSGSERPGVTLLDVVPLSLGLETMGGIVEVIIPRNATIPIGARQTFTNYSEKQTGITINVVQGERELVQDCRSLASFELKGIPSLPPSMARIEVAFQLDADGLLTVTAKELMTGVQQSVEVKPSYGLSTEEIDRMIVESESHAREDFSARNQAEARVELGRVVLALRTLLQEVGHLESIVSKEEQVALNCNLERADRLMQDSQSDAVALKAEREQLEKVSEPLARRRMERILRSGMDGKSIREIESALNSNDQEKLDDRSRGCGDEVWDSPERSE